MVREAQALSKIVVVATFAIKTRVDQPPQVQLDNLAQALDAPRGAGRIRQAQRCFVELTESLRKDARRRGCFHKQKLLF